MQVGVSQKPGFKAPLCHFLTVCPQLSHPASEAVSGRGVTLKRPVVEVGCSLGHCKERILKQDRPSTLLVLSLDCARDLCLNLDIGKPSRSLDAKS